MTRLCYFPITQKLSLLFVIANGFIIIQTFIHNISKIYFYNNNHYIAYYVYKIIIVRMNSSMEAQYGNTLKF